MASSTLARAGISATLLFAMKQRPCANVLWRGLGVGLVLVSAAACIFLLWPDRSSNETLVTLPPPATAPPVSESAFVPQPALAPRTKSLADSPAARPSSIKLTASYRNLPPQCDLRAITATYIEVSRRSALAEQRLMAIVDADPESKQVTGAIITQLGED